jgi:hypothetical protein
MSGLQAFILPNGSLLKYAHGGVRGSQDCWYLSLDTAELRKPRTKKSLYKIGLRNSGSDQFVVPADFDTLPEGYEPSEAGWASFRHQLSSLLHGRAIVAPSASGKAKAFFVAQLPPGVALSDQAALSILQTELPADLFSIIDRSHASLRITYANPELVEVLSTGLSHLPPISYHPKVGEYGSVAAGHNFYEFKGDIRWPALLALAEQREEWSHFICILLRTWHLASDGGFALPQSKLAKQLNTSQGNVCRWLNKLVDLGLLERGRSYTCGVQAKTYWAQGELKAAILELKAEHLQCSAGVAGELPRAIKDGTWHAMVFLAARRLETLPLALRGAAFVEWYLTLPNWWAKDRPRKAAFILLKRWGLSSDPINNALSQLMGNAA